MESISEVNYTDDMSTYILKFLYRSSRFLFRKLYSCWSTFYAKYVFLVNDVKYGSGFKSNGIPIIDINKKCQFRIGDSFKINNGLHFNRIGRQQPCFFIADYGGIISIGDNVGLSGTAIVCHKQVSIGSNVRIGGNTVIYDTDFHNLDFVERTVAKEDMSTVIKKAIVIEDNVFIGAHSTILKGVTIGRNSIIGASSVVTKNVPTNQIWGGNPARFLKYIGSEHDSNDKQQIDEFVNSFFDVK